MVNAISGEVSAASFAAGPADTDFIILDNFDDNLSRQAGRWTVRDPALAHLLASWTGKLLITYRQPFTLTARADDEAVLTVAFAAPAPLGLLQAHH